MPIKIQNATGCNSKYGFKRRQLCFYLLFALIIFGNVGIRDFKL